jgi:hypothetical protein
MIMIVIMIIIMHIMIIIIMIIIVICRLGYTRRMLAHSERRLRSAMCGGEWAASPSEPPLTPKYTKANLILFYCCHVLGLGFFVEGFRFF